MVPVKCGICGHKQHWKCKGGSRLKDLTCGSCGAAQFKRDHYAERKQRTITEATAEDHAADAAPALPGEYQLRYATLKALERMAASLEDLVAMGAQAGYGRAMLTGARRAPEPAQVEAGNHEPARGRLHVILTEDPRDRLKFKPRKGDRLWFAPGRFTDVVAPGSHALTVRERKGHELYETAITRDQWQAAVDIAERIEPSFEEDLVPVEADTARAGA